MDTAYTGHLMHSEWKASALHDLFKSVEKSFDDPRKICWSLGNHDIMRLWARMKSHEDNEEFWRMLIAMYFCLEGYLCWYQGDELGLAEADITFDLLQDPFGIAFWPEFKGRDGCRTPMPWQHEEVHGGFTTHEKPWLPVPENHQNRAASKQVGTANSFYEYTKACVRLRRDNPALAGGTMTLLECQGNQLAFTRQNGEQKIICVFNFGAKAVTLDDLPKGRVLFESHREGNNLAHYGIFIIDIS